MNICFMSFFSSILFQMALDGKAIKEEIPDKDAYDARKVKGKSWTFILYTLLNTIDT